VESPTIISAASAGTTSFRPRTTYTTLRDVTVAGELGVAIESLRSWNKQHDIDAGVREGLTSAEREELRELKRKLLRVEQERDLLKRAAAFFARETEIR
jgi:transposase-like protein